MGGYANITDPPKNVKRVANAVTFNTCLYKEKTQ